MKVIPLIAAVFILASASRSQNRIMDPLLMANIKRDITYCTADGVPLKMDIYLPKAAGPKPIPVILYVHGGGWTSGDKARGFGARLFGNLVMRGYAVAAANYRLAPQHKFPAQIEDVKCAVRYLRANAKTYNIDPNKIGAVGGSAGGHLVALLGLTGPKAGFEGKGGYPGVSSRVQAVVDMFGPTDLTNGDFPSERSRLIKLVFGAESVSSPILKRASPVTYVSKNAPPFLILHGDKDKVVPLRQSQELYDKLKAAGVDAKLVIVKNAGHGFKPEGGRISPSVSQIANVIGGFFDEHLLQLTSGPQDTASGT